ncbi:MAG: hydantoinase/oxoprolinase family protein [Pseudomonadota bacterium]
MTSVAVKYCGWDIGGAHLKFAAVSGTGQLIAVDQLACPLWQGLSYLESAIARLAIKFDFTAALHAATMTGELCDSFGDRHTGVQQIIATFSSALSAQACRFYSLDGGLLPAAQAKDNSTAVASANWSATASFIAKHVENALVVDVGSTTTDLMPIKNHILLARGADDFTRLQQAELIYTGIVRTPIAALVRALPFAGIDIPVVTETFATVADAYRVLGKLPDDADLHATCDDAEKSPEASARRLFRMIGRDYGGEFTAAVAMAEAIEAQQLKQISAGVDANIADHDLTREDTMLVGLGAGVGLLHIVAKNSGLQFCEFESLLRLPNSGAAVSPNVCGPAVAMAYESANADGLII